MGAKTNKTETKLSTRAAECKCRSARPELSTSCASTECWRERPRSHPIRVTPIATRSPSPNMDVFLHARSSAVNVPSDAPLPSATPSDDMIFGLRKDRRAFYM